MRARAAAALAAAAAAAGLAAHAPSAGVGDAALLPPSADGGAGPTVDGSSAVAEGEIPWPLLFSVENSVTVDTPTLDEAAAVLLKNSSEYFTWYGNSLEYDAERPNVAAIRDCANMCNALFVTTPAAAHSALAAPRYWEWEIEEWADESRVHVSLGVTSPRLYASNSLNRGVYYDGNVHNTVRSIGLQYGPQLHRGDVVGLLLWVAGGDMLLFFSVNRVSLGLAAVIDYFAFGPAVPAISVRRIAEAGAAAEGAGQANAGAPATRAPAAAAARGAARSVVRVAFRERASLPPLLQQAPFARTWTTGGFDWFTAATWTMDPKALGRACGIKPLGEGGAKPEGGVERAQWPAAAAEPPPAAPAAKSPAAAEPLTPLLAPVSPPLALLAPASPPPASRRRFPPLPNQLLTGLPGLFWRQAVKPPTLSFSRSRPQRLSGVLSHPLGTAPFELIAGGFQGDVRIAWARAGQNPTVGRERSLGAPKYRAAQVPGSQNHAAVLRALEHFFAQCVIAHFDGLYALTLLELPTIAQPVLVSWSTAGTARWLAGTELIKPAHVVDLDNGL